MLAPVAMKNLTCPIYCSQSIRSLWVFKHAFDHAATKPGQEQRSPMEKLDFQKYRLVLNDSGDRLPLVSVIFTKDVEGIALAGECKQIRSHMFREYYMPQGLAVYATKYNVKKYSPLFNKDKAPQEEKSLHESITLEQSRRFLELFKYCNSKAIPIYVNLEHEWTLEKWHLRVGLRMQDVHVTMQEIIMNKQIAKGPDLALQNKLFRFYVVADKRAVIPCAGRYQHITNKSYKQMLTPSLPDPTLVTDELMSNSEMVEENFYIHPEEISFSDAEIWDFMQKKMEEKKEQLKQNPPKLSQREEAQIEEERRKKKEIELAELYRKTFTYEHEKKIPIEQIEDPIQRRVAMFHKRRFHYWDDDEHVFNQPLGRPLPKK